MNLVGRFWIHEFVMPKDNVQLLANVWDPDFSKDDREILARLAHRLFRREVARAGRASYKPWKKVDTSLCT